MLQLGDDAWTAAGNFVTLLLAAPLAWCLWAWFRQLHSAGSPPPVVWLLPAMTMVVSVLAISSAYYGTARVLKPVFGINLWDYGHLTAMIRLTAMIALLGLWWPVFAGRDGSRSRATARVLMIAAVSGVVFMIIGWVLQ